jgi:hypothetical protein
MMQGISQCLLIVRLGFAKERLGDVSRDVGNNSSDTNKVTIAVCRETVTCDHGQFILEKGGPHHAGSASSESSSLSERSVV